MADILTTDRYPAVRAALDVALDAATLPDGTIGLSIYAGATERAVKRLVPTWAAILTAAGDDAARLGDAAVLWCAGLLAPAVPNLVSESIGQRDYQYTRQGPTPAEQAKALRAAARAELAHLAGATAALPIVFARAPGGRGQSNGVVAYLPDGTRVLGVG